jgi:hypothetical protein
MLPCFVCLCNAASDPALHNTRSEAETDQQASFRASKSSPPGTSHHSSRTVRGAPVRAVLGSGPVPAETASQSTRTTLILYENLFSLDVSTLELLFGLGALGPVLAMAWQRAPLVQPSAILALTPSPHGLLARHNAGLREMRGAARRCCGRQHDIRPGPHGNASATPRLAGGADPERHPRRRYEGQGIRQLHADRRSACQWALCRLLQQPPRGKHEREDLHRCAPPTLRVA